jgi:AcrR family transcriptional regulator
VSVSPQRKDAARNREAILDAGRDLMAVSRDFPMSEVARRAGVGQATLYRHFPTDVVRENPDAWRQMERMRDELIVLVEGPLAGAKAAGIVRDDVRAEDVFLVLAMIDGALQGTADRARRRVTAERVRELAMRGMAAPRA